MILRNSPSFCVWMLSVVLFLISSSSSTQAQSVVSQAITLKEGWNAIWLEVQPTVATGEDAGKFAKVEMVFDAPEIELITTPRNVFSPSAYKFDPTNTGFVYSEESWQVWRKNPVVNTNSLLRVTGNRPYLIKVADGGGTVSLNVSGSVRYFEYQWKPDAHNLLGFGVESGSEPSFASFFAPQSAKHPLSEIYALSTEGTWAQVDPSAQMKSGTAYWIYANGASNYSGPLAIGFTEEASGVLNFGSDLNSIAIEDGAGAFANYTLRQLTFSSIQADSAVTATVEKVVPTGLVENDDLRVFQIRPEPDTLDYTVVSAFGDAAPVFEVEVPASSSTSLFLGASRHWNSGGSSRENVYKVKADTGDGISYRYLPVSGTTGGATADESATANASYTGLWVGNVSLSQVTSITEVGSPIIETEASAPMKVILHSDDSSAVSLLSQVTWMREASASDLVSPEQVLVLDTAKIPFYEGIEERAGKKVGRRIETVSYDMPRITTTTAQPTLLADIVAESQNPDTLWSEGRGLYADTNSVTASAIESYLNFVSSRPPSLVESYATAWPLSGTLSPGFAVNTTAPLALDPYHRSNPFRHAFHPQHGKGRSITRAFSIELDPNQSSTQKLTGTFTETTTGITQEPIVSKGSITLFRVNEVATLID